MYRNKEKNRWEASSPNDLIGWKITSPSMEQIEPGTFAVQVTNGRESRTVYATMEAIPLHSVERFIK